MPAIDCAKCGGKTNTAVAHWLSPIRPDKKAHECYLRVENGIWVKGCGWDNADPVYEKPSLENYLGKKA